MDKKRLHVHLVSDSTGETVSSVARAATAQFDNIDVEEHNWALIRTPAQLKKVLNEIKEEPGVVLYTLVQPELRRMIIELCGQLKIPCVPVVEHVTKEISAYLGIEVHAQPGKQHELNEDYFSRMEAVNFALSHDDGQAGWDLEEADILLVGASRTSKTPTCIYLAYRGYRAANVPFVPGVPMPEQLDRLKTTLVVGLSINPERLVQIRKNRLLALKEEKDTSYVDLDIVKDEVAAARKYFSVRRWPVIDVTRRSVEETAASIIQLYQKWQEERQ